MKIRLAQKEAIVRTVGVMSLALGLLMLVWAILFGVDHWWPVWFVLGVWWTTFLAQWIVATVGRMLLMSLRETETRIAQIHAEEHAKPQQP